MTEYEFVKELGAYDVQWTKRGKRELFYSHEHWCVRNFYSQVVMFTGTFDKAWLFYNTGRTI
jgi:hypothetical protein